MQSQVWCTIMRTLGDLQKISIYRTYIKTECLVNPVCISFYCVFYSCGHGSKSLDLDSERQHMTLNWILYCRGKHCGGHY